MSAIKEATSTHNCKTPDCANEAPSSRGIMAYCKTCRDKRLADPSLRGSEHRVKLSTNEEKVRNLLNAARRLDRAERTARTAIEEVKEARFAHRQALITISEQLGIQAVEEG